MSTSDPHHATQDVFERILARPVAAPDLQHGRLVHLQWRAPEQGERLVQFYLNGLLSGSSRSVTQREAWLLVDAKRHVQIELLAVRPASVGVDLSSELEGADPPTRPVASLSLLRDVSLPMQSRLAMRHTDASLDEQIALFQPGDARSGFGAVFGEGGFGYDTSTGPGLGLGELGYGSLGSDGDALHWRSDHLPPGTNTIDLSLEDQSGVLQSLSLNLEIDRLPDPPQDLTINHALQLTWT